MKGKGCLDSNFLFNQLVIFFCHFKYIKFKMNDDEFKRENNDDDIWRCVR